MVFFKFSKRTPCILILTDIFGFTHEALQVIINGRVPGKELFNQTLDFLYNFIPPDQAEAGSAEEQPARNNPARYASVNSR